MRALVARICTAFASGMRALDYGLIVLVIGFAVAAPIGRPVVALISAVEQSRPSPFASYDAALREAAIKRPEYEVSLATITPDVETPPRTLSEY